MFTQINTEEIWNKTESNTFENKNIKMYFEIKLYFEILRSQSHASISMHYSQCELADWPQIPYGAPWQTL